MSDPSNIKQIQFKTLNQSSPEIILPPEFVDLITCNKNQYFINGTCIYITNKIPNCIFQIDNSICGKCSSSYYLSKGTCTLYCPKNNYVNSVNECSSCSTGCSECQGGSPCTKCEDPFFTAPDCYQKCKIKLKADLSSFSNSMYKLDIPLNSNSEVIAFDAYIWVPMYVNSYSRKYNIDFYPLMLGRSFSRKNWSFYYALNDFKYNNDTNMYKNISSDFHISPNSWHRLIMINDLSKSAVNCSLDEINIPTSNPDIFFQNKGFFINRLNEQYLTYVKDLKIWTTRSINTMNYYNLNNNFFINFSPSILLAYYKMLEGQELSITDSVHTTSTKKIDNSKNRNYNYIWTSMVSCPQGKYWNFTSPLIPSSCIDCPLNCKSCSFGLGIIKCTICEEGFYIKNNNCMESSNKGLSLVNENSNRILIYNNSNGLNTTWTTIFWINIFDYNNVNLLASNDVIYFKFISIYLDNSSNMNFKGYSDTVQFNYNLSFDQWTVISVSWNTGNTGGNIYLYNNNYNNLNGAKKLISNNYPLKTIYIGGNSFGVFRRLQLLKTNTTYDEAIKSSFLKF